MSKVFRPWDVDEVWLFPAWVQDFVPPGHIAHLIRETVREGLDLRAILSQYDEERGYPPYHPGMTTALYALCLQPGDLLVAADRSGLPRARRLYGGDGGGLPRFPPDQRGSPAASGGAIGAVCAGPLAVPPKGAGQARPLRAPRHPNQGEPPPAQG